jgi:hypothetical protein
MFFSPGIIATIIAFLASLSVYFFVGSPFYLRFFPPFLLTTLIVELTAGYIISKGGHTLVLYNVFSIVNYCFYLFVLGEIVRSKRVKKLIWWSIGLLVLLSIINLLYVQKISSFNSMTFSLGALLIVSFCIYYFFELFQLPTAVNLLREPAFWISSGLLFFFVCSYPFFGLVNFISTASRVMIYKFSFLIELINVFFYLLFTISFLCRIRTRKSM